MTQKKYNRLVELLRQTSPEVILKASGRCDGHGIFDPKAFTDVGVPQEIVDHLTSTYKSDGSPKGTIFVKGQAVRELKGIYGLDALTFIAEGLGVKYESKMGRGFQAQAIQYALHQHFANVAPKSDDKPAGC